MPFAVETPLWESEPLQEILGSPVLLKMEALQPCGSFKIRGLGRVCATRVAGGATHLWCSSGGNAGLAVAYAGKRLKVPVTVVVPETTSAWARAGISAQGAEVIEYGDHWYAAHEHARERMTEGAAYIHPFDDPEIWAGHAPMIGEAARQGPKPAAVVVTVGGGGLLCGVMSGMHAIGWTDVPVLAVETDGAASLAAAMAAGQVVALDRITSIAGTLGARAVAEEALEWTHRHPIQSVVVPDRTAVQACLRFADDHRVLVEPACGAGLSVIYDRNPALQGLAGPVLVIVCGGAGVSVELLRAWDERTRGAAS